MKEAFDKIIQVIGSCKNTEHIYCCMKLIRNFRRKYREEDEVNDHMHQLIEVYIAKEKNL